MNRVALVVETKQYDHVRAQLAGTEMTALHPLIIQPRKFNVVVVLSAAWYQASEAKTQSIIKSWVEEHGELVIA